VTAQPEPSQTEIALLATAVAQDHGDALSASRSLFSLPPGITYLDGNSLGAKPASVNARVNACIDDEWGASLIRSWNDHGWWDKARNLGDRLGRLIGAAPGQTLLTDNLSVNLFKAVASAIRMRADRSLILADRTSFPSDLYVLEGVVSLFPQVSLVLSETPDDSLQILRDRGSDVAVVLFNHIDFKTARRLPMHEFTEAAHNVGALTIWDLAHSIGAIPISLDRCDVDFAVGCTYKYVNGGPGAPGFIYVASRLQQPTQREQSAQQQSGQQQSGQQQSGQRQSASQPIQGWWAHADPFAFETSFRPIDNVMAFATGTQPILSMVALEASLDIWDDVDMNAVETKAGALTDFFIHAVNTLAADARIIAQLRCGSPADATVRGSHVIFHHEHGYPIMRALIDSGVIGDFRAPDVLRFGFAPLYNTFAETLHAAKVLVHIVATKAWEAPEFNIRGAVT
jgi:kynureninase